MPPSSLRSTSIPPTMFKNLAYQNVMKLAVLAGLDTPDGHQSFQNLLASRRHVLVEYDGTYRGGYAIFRRHLDRQEESKQNRLKEYLSIAYFANQHLLGLF